MTMIPSMLGFLQGTGVLLLCLTVSFLWKLMSVRRKMRDLPGPPHHWLWGHLGIAIKMSRAFPPDVFPNLYWQWLRDTYNLDGVFYFDTWPLGPPLVLVTDADMADQLTVQHSLPKHPIVPKYICQFLGKKNMVSADGPVWKASRTIFNPGFSSSNLISLVPSMLESALEFRSILREHAGKGDVFPMEEAAMRWTFDFIGKITFGAKLNAQRTDNELVAAFRRQIEYLPKGTTFSGLPNLNPFRKYAQWRNSCIMDNYIERQLIKRFGPDAKLTHKQGEDSEKCIIDVALNREQELDSSLKRMVIDQVKTFLFAGHDSTSTTISNLYYLLSRNPQARLKAVAELDAVFGIDNHQTVAKIICENPHTLNQLPYCLAVIKETLRIFPTAGTTRAGEKDFFLVDESGARWPTHDWVIWPVAYCLSRDPKYYPEPHQFLPERFLPDRSPYPPIPSGAWRPFERGPRACIGKEMALLQLKLIMALTLRTFQFEAVYPDGSMEIEGHKCYQVLLGSAKPKGGMPMVVRMADPLK